MSIREKSSKMFRLTILVTAVFYLPSSEAIKCKEETLTDVPTESRRNFCVFRDVTWHPGVAEPVFEQPIGTRVAFVDSNLTSIPNSFFAQVPRLDTLVVNKVHLTKLTIKNSMKVVYAEGNSIVQILVDGGNSLKELHLTKNDFKKLDSLSALVCLEKLDLSETGIASSSETIDFGAFAHMHNLTELHLANTQAHYIENTKAVILPNLKELDLQGNPIISSNFEMSIFRSMPKLEELNMYNTLMNELSVSPNIREDLPALKKINIGAMKLPCKVMSALLDILKDNEIEIVGTSTTTLTQCNTGYQVMDGLCCRKDGSAPLPPPTQLTTTQTPEDKHTPPVNKSTKTEGTGPDGPKISSKSETGEEGGSLTVVIVSVFFAIILIIGVGVFVAIYCKRRNGTTHKPANISSVCEDIELYK